MCELIVVQMLYNRPSNYESKKLFGKALKGRNVRAWGSAPGEQVTPEEKP
jgi:hypothetical protein